MRSHEIAGGGGTRLHVVEKGNPAGRPIFFIHGFSQCELAWSRQMQSDLAGDYRLVAMDLRGHGLSDKPDRGYGDSRMWADDVGAVIRFLALDHPVLCGWSYGPLVILDYLRHYGDAAIGGIHFVSGISKLGSAEAMSVLTPEFLSLVPGFFSSDVEASVHSLGSLLRLCVARPLETEVFYLMLGYNLCVPPRVREALLTRSIDNDDLLTKLRLPVLITHGVDDAVVKPAAANLHKAAMPHALLHMMAGTGHAPFWEDAVAFNRHLRLFVQSL